MSYTPGQRRALDRAREFLAADPNDVTGTLAEQWHTAARLALRDILAEFPADEDEEPVPERIMQAFLEHIGGYCTCGGHVSHDGTFTPPEIVTMPGAIHTAVPVRAL